MPRMTSGNRGPRLSANRRSFVPGLAAGAAIATLSRPFGTGTSFAVVGSPPAQLALSSGAIVAGASGGVAGTSYEIKLRATAADGRREVAETLVFACAEAPVIDVLLVIGDSNARGQAADEAALSYASDAQILTWDGSAFVAYAPGARTGVLVPGALAGSETRIGPEMQFARAYRAANPARTLAIVKYARAGSFQGYGAGAPVNGDAGNSWHPGSGSLVAGATAALEAATAWLGAQGFAPRVVAAVDVLGTNDATDATLAAAVQATKAAMYAAFRTSPAWGASALFLTQRMKSDSPQPQLGIVRSAQMAVANGAADAVLVSTDGFAHNPGDLTHYDLSGLIQCGNALHAAWAARMNQRLLALGSKALFYLDAATADTVIAAGGFAGSITDQVGNRAISQATGANQPAYGTPAIHARPALDFDGSNDALARLSANGMGSGDREGFAIVTSDSLAADTTTRTIYARGGGTSPSDIRLSRVVSGGISRFRLQAGIGGGLNYSVIDNQVVAEGGPFVLHWRIAGSTAYISVNGQPEQSASLTAAPAIGDSGLWIGSANGAQWFDGKLRLAGETTALTSGERAALIADLLAEAGL